MQKYWLSAVRTPLLFATIVQRTLQEHSNAKRGNGLIAYSDFLVFECDRVALSIRGVAATAFGTAMHLCK